MRILAIDSSGLVATVAVVEEENEISKTIAEYTINYKKTHSQTLLPMLDEIVKMTDMNLDTIDAIAVAGGPGSFTGLRILRLFECYFPFQIRLFECYFASSTISICTSRNYLIYLRTILIINKG